MRDVVARTGRIWAPLGGRRGTNRRADTPPRTRCQPPDQRRTSERTAIGSPPGELSQRRPRERVAKRDDMTVELEGEQIELAMSRDEALAGKRPGASPQGD